MMVFFNHQNLGGFPYLEVPINEGIPIAGWFISGTPNVKWRQLETTIDGNLIFSHQRGHGLWAFLRPQGETENVASKVGEIPSEIKAGSWGNHRTMGKIRRSDTVQITLVYCAWFCMYVSPIIQWRL